MLLFRFPRWPGVSFDDLQEKAKPRGLQFLYGRGHPPARPEGPLPPAWPRASPGSVRWGAESRRVYWSTMVVDVISSEALSPWPWLSHPTSRASPTSISSSVTRQAPRPPRNHPSISVDKYSKPRSQASCRRHRSASGRGDPGEVAGVGMGLQVFGRVSARAAGLPATKYRELKETAAAKARFVMLAPCASFRRRWTLTRSASRSSQQTREPNVQPLWHPRRLDGGREATSWRCRGAVAERAKRDAARSGARNCA